MRAQWEWQLVRTGDPTMPRPPGPVFTGRYDAEQWLGEHWRALAAEGVEKAQLLHDGEPVGAVVALPDPHPVPPAAG